MTLSCFLSASIQATFRSVVRLCLIQLWNLFTQVPYSFWAVFGVARLRCCMKWTALRNWCPTFKLLLYSLSFCCAFQLFLDNLYRGTWLDWQVLVTKAGKGRHRTGKGCLQEQVQRQTVCHQLNIIEYMCAIVFIVPLLQTMLLMTFTVVNGPCQGQ